MASNIFRTAFCLCAFAAASNFANDTNDLLGAEAGNSLEDLLNRAELQLERCNSRNAVPILDFVSRNFRKKELEDFSMDGYSGAFLVDASLCRAYRLQGPSEGNTNYHLAYYHGKKALERAMNRESSGNVKRLALLLWELAQLPEDHPGEAKEFRDHAIDLFPGSTPEMINARAADANHYRSLGRHAEAADRLEQLLSQTPYVRAHIYFDLMKTRVVQKDYRSLLRWWIEALRKSDIETANPDYVFQLLWERAPYATLDELEELRETLKGAAARCPATMQNVRASVKWLKLSDNEYLTEEIKVRRAEMENEPDITNIWLDAYEKHHQSAYAEKLEKYNELTGAFCSEMRREDRPYLTRKSEPCAAEKIEAILDKLDSKSILHYRNTLKYRADKFRDNDNSEVRKMVREVDARVAQLDKENPEWEV